MDPLCADSTDLPRLNSETTAKLDEDMESFKTPKKLCDWASIFLGFAHELAKRSGDETVGVGCVIANTQNQILGIGYNGEVKGFEESFANNFNDKELMVHAEMNAIAHSVRSLVGEKLIIYVTRTPCPNCMKLLAQYDIVAIFQLKPVTKVKYAGTWKICETKKIPLITNHNFFRVDKSNAYPIERGETPNDWDITQLTCEGDTTELTYKFEWSSDFELTDEEKCCFDFSTLKDKQCSDTNLFTVSVNLPKTTLSDLINILRISKESLQKHLQITEFETNESSARKAKAFEGPPKKKRRRSES